MAIEVTRLPKARNNFERVPNEAIRNVELSIAALGLLDRLLADGSAFSSIDAMANFYSPQSGTGRRRGTGRDAYRAAAKELEAAGHLVRTRVVVNGLITCRISVFAEPYVPDVQAVPMTAEPSPVRPAETMQSRSSEQETAKPSSAPPAEADQNPSSARTTAEPLPAPPAETSHSRRSLRTTAKPSSFLTDVFTDLQTSSTSVANPTSDLSVPGKEVEEEFAKKADPELQDRAEVFVDKLPYDRRPSRSERAELLRLVVVALAAGWSEVDLLSECERSLDGVRNRIGLWIRARLKSEELGPPSAFVPKPRTSNEHRGWRQSENPKYGRPTRPSRESYRNPADNSGYHEPL